MKKLFFEFVIFAGILCQIYFLAGRGAAEVQNQAPLPAAGIELPAASLSDAQIVNMMATNPEGLNQMIQGEAQKIMANGGTPPAQKKANGNDKLVSTFLGPHHQ